MEERIRGIDDREKRERKTFNPKEEATIAMEQRDARRSETNPSPVSPQTNIKTSAILKSKLP